jgi:hypothetical protein
VDCLTTIRALKSIGVSVYFEKEDIDTAHVTSEMMIAIPGTLAQEESISISGNMRWSYKKRMETGDFIGCRATYGYELVKGMLEINEQESEIVRQIFEMYLSGMGKQKIANKLNQMAIPKRYGHECWYVSGIDYILNNERYIGDALLQKKYTTDNLPFRKVRNHGEKSQYYVENSHPPIIDREMFHAVKRLQETKKHDCQPKHSYPLTKMLICTECGHYYRRAISGNKAYWLCGYYASGRSNCSSIRVYESDIYDAFTRIANKLWQYHKYILIPMIEQTEQMQMKSNGTQIKVYEIDKQIADFNAQNLVLARLKSKDILDSADYSAQSMVINQKVNRLRADRRKLLQEDENDEMLCNLKALYEAISNLRDYVSNFDESLFENIVDSISVKSRTELCFKLIGGLELNENIPYKERRCKRA